MNPRCLGSAARPLRGGRGEVAVVDGIRRKLRTCRALLVASALHLAVLAPPIAAQMVWAEQPFLTERAMTGGAYDSARQRFVMFSGYGSGIGADTWEWDGTAWAKSNPPTSPRARIGHAMAYDAARGRVVLFGGFAGIDENDETWEWDGSDWVLREPQSRPPGRWKQAMAYDSGRGRIVLFGGEVDRGVHANDTWEWDGTDWHRREPAMAPSPRFFHAMAYDAARGETVLFSGGGGGTSGDTWAWDGTSWAQRTPFQLPPAREQHSVVYDAARQRVVLFAGDGGGPRPLSDTWEWDGSDWLLRSNNLARRYGQVAAYDSARSRVLMFGGQTSSTQWLSDTWEWDGTGWLEVASEQPFIPEARAYHTLVYDPRRQRTVLYGGDFLTPGIGGTRQDTWEWDGSSWVEIIPQVRPVISRAASTYDWARQVVLMFGGLFAAETWEWDGTTWAQRIPAQSPPQREYHGLAYDTARQRTVMFGGGVGIAVVGDTWEWDGTTWTEIFPKRSPAPRQGSPLVYDEVRERVMLFGGGNGNSLFATRFTNDTWEWDGTDWTQLFPATVPPERCEHGLVYDSRRRRVVMFGGRNFANTLSDTWEWDGTDWRQVTTVGNPLGRRAIAATYDRRLNRMVMFAGMSGTVRASKGDRGVWEYYPTHAASATAVGTPCRGTAGFPSLTAQGPAVLGNQNFAVQISAVLPQTAVALFLAGAPGSAPLGGGCTLYVQPPLVTLLSASDGSGVAELALPIPYRGTLAGSALETQGLAFDPAGPFASLAVFSAGLRIEIGN